MPIASLCRRTFPRLSFPLLVLAAFGTPALAAEPGWLGEADCRIAPLKPTPSGAVSWTGACVDGYASGKGVLAWNAASLNKVTLEATLVRGEASGEAVLKRRDYTYTGTTKNGVPEGTGYFAFQNGKGWYEGEVLNGMPHGKGIYLTAHRSEYKGEFVMGKKHGWGEETFATGGSYAGGWKNDAFDGHGAIVHAGSGHKYEGQFKDGRVAGLAAPEIAAGQYAIKDTTVGSRIPENRLVAYLPLTAGWDQLTPAQKNKMRANYPALEAGDDPPFPAKGEGALFNNVRRINEALGAVTGDLAVYVLVGKDGKPQRVTTYGAPTPEMVRAVSHLFMLEQYKPALCRGEPCEMIYPVNFSFSISN
ncbi:MORN repeat-containing protein [Massilia niabensis]|uniref:MORN repeat-containing protein n=1 Tax=Massilia niabensis TaxID=544910 RepID=A0ABW0L526_9BURK